MSKYLGVLLIKDQSQLVSIYSAIIEKIYRRLAAWKSNITSLGARTLIGCEFHVGCVTRLTNLPGNAYGLQGLIAGISILLTSTQESRLWKRNGAWKKKVPSWSNGNPSWKNCHCYNQMRPESRNYKYLFI
ncbi:hypothetical protein BDE02_01G058500 [Populus trichocarpa]|nr:hypothetical protein BDE02_01G058500 [Populus trichocarpa]